MWYESSNNVYGTTIYSNPYNIDCMVGGSSGGERSINVAACSIFGIGGDISGSVRMPVAFLVTNTHFILPPVVTNFLLFLEALVLM